MTDALPPAGLFAFQQAFSRHLRAPEQVALPPGLPARQGRLYETLLFNNVCGFIDRCFPVSKSLHSAEEWRALCRAFYRDWVSETPYFKQIPREFVEFLGSGKDSNPRRPWLAELVHYEWVELAAQTATDVVARPPCELTERGRIAANPSLHNLAYEWPVHTLSATAIPSHPEPTFILVFRNQQHQVQFVQINPITSALVGLFQEAPQTLGQALNVLAERLGWAVDAALQRFAWELVQTLVDQQALYSLHADGGCK